LDFPFGLAPPLLVDDADFDLAYHVIGLSACDDPEGFRGALRKFVAGRLEQSRPLWQIALVPDLTGGHSALLIKLHHAIVEGEGALSAIGTLLFARGADAPTQASPVWAPQPRPGAGMRTRLMVNYWRQRVAVLASAVVMAFRGIPRFAARRAAIADMWRTQLQTKRPFSVLNAPVGPRNEVVVASFAVAAVQRIRETTNAAASFDDVILAALTGGLRRWYIDRGLRPEAPAVQLPLSVARRGLGVSKDFLEMPPFMVVTLPANEPDRSERLRQICRMTAERRTQADAVQDLIFPRTLLPMPLYKRCAGRIYDRAANFHLASLRGPAAQLYVLGCPIETAYIATPVRGTLALRIAVLVLGGNVTVTLSCDPDIVKEPDQLACAIEGEIAAMADATAFGPSGITGAAARP
jgi:WS/DGAT/MGAT family acyltransferase